MEVFEFCPENGTHKVTAWLQPKLSECPGKIYPVMVVVPGGGYRYTSVREGEPVAMRYFAAGYHTFIVDYPVEEAASDFRPLRQLAAAVAHIRSHAAAWRLDPDKVAVCGFSAGGHLAASLGVLHNDPVFLEACSLVGNVRPDALVLSYPVILANRFTHRDSLRRVSGHELGTPEADWWSLDTHVDGQTPPTFLWHTAADATVPVENSLTFAAALSAAKVPFEYHVLPQGKHGMGTCTAQINSFDPYNARWVDWSIAWLSQTLNYNG